MPKRQRSTRLSDDDWEQDVACLSDISDNRDACFTVKQQTRTQKPTRKACKRARDADGPSSANGALARTPESFVHPISLHSIREPADMRVELLKWYKTVQNNRGMPWRKPYDPNLGNEGRAQRAYEVWVSEIMLQQTQVATVIPYYNRWMTKFPTIFDLANTTLDEVNALWKGLGYYSRAKRLLQGAQKIVKDYEGILPDSARSLEAHVPGIGRYSGGAISSIAYGEKVAAVDGNVQRVMSRLLALHASPKAKSTLDILWAGARALVETIDISNAQHPGDINQALIELGSTVCKVSDPNCGSCPLQRHCSAYEIVNNSDGDKSDIKDIEDICHVCDPFAPIEDVTVFPMRAERKKAREEVDIVNVVEWRCLIDPPSRHFLMVKRPDRGLLAGLYEFPSFVDVSRNSSEENLTAEILSKLRINKSDLTRSATKSVGDVQHIFSHIRKTYRARWILLESDTGPPPPIVFDCGENLPSGKPKSKKVALTTRDEKINTRWVSMKEVDDMNMGTGVVKIWNLTKKMWE